MMEIIRDKGDYDNREEHAGRWAGHTGAVAVDQKWITLVREYTDGANIEKLTIKKWGKGIRVFLLDEEGRTTTRIFWEISFNEAADWLAGQSDEDFQGGPTYIFYYLLLPKLAGEGDRRI